MTPVPAGPDGGTPPLQLFGPVVGDAAPHQVEWVIGGRAYVLSYWPAPQWDGLPEYLRPDDAVPLGDGGWVVLRGRD